MKLVMQTNFEAPTGNCVQACIASILDLELDQVPNFMELDSDWVEAIDAFLFDYGLQVVQVRAEDHFVPRGYHLISGLSPRGDYWHSLVGYRGKPVHDPFPGGNCELLDDEPWTWALFVALNPGAWAYVREEPCQP